MKRTTIMSTMLLTIFAAATSYAACTAINSLPKIITSAGNYCLTGNLTTNQNGTAISINSSNVVLDLAGWEIRNTVIGSGAGIGYNDTNGVIKNIMIKNGRVIGFNNGIMFHKTDNAGETVAQDVLIDGVTVVHNTGGTEPFQYPDQGIHVDADNLIVRNCIVDSSGTAASSIAVIGDRVSVINNDIFNPGGDAIYTDKGPAAPKVSYIIDNNRIMGPGGTGVIAYTDNTIVKNNSIANMGTGISFADGNHGLYRDNTAVNCPTPFSAPASFDGGGNKSN
jgi:hypothetical protein